MDATSKEMVPIYSATKVGPDISEIKFEDRFLCTYGYSIFKKVYKSEEVDSVEVWVRPDLVSLLDSRCN